MNARQLLGKQITDYRNLRRLTLRQLAELKITDGVMKPVKSLAFAMMVCKDSISIRIKTIN